MRWGSSLESPGRGDGHCVTFKDIASAQKTSSAQHSLARFGTRQCETRLASLHQPHALLPERDSLDKSVKQLDLGSQGIKQSRLVWFEMNSWTILLFSWTLFASPQVASLGGGWGSEQPRLVWTQMNSAFKSSRGYFTPQPQTKQIGMKQLQVGE